MNLDKRLDFTECITLVMILVFGMSSNAFTQVINVEDQRKSEGLDRWATKLDLTSNFNQNTQKVWQGSAKTQVDYNDTLHTVILFGGYNFVRTGQANPLNEGFGHLRYNFKFEDSSRVIAESFLQYQYNEVQKIQLRQLYGLGLRFVVFRKEKFGLFLGTSAMYEYERVRNEIDLNKDIRSSNYITLKWTGEKFQVSHVTYYQPLYRFIGDYRVSTNSTLRWAIAKSFDLKLSFEYLHDSRPPDQIPLDIFTISQGLSLHF